MKTMTMLTGKVRLSYPSLFEKAPTMKDGEKLAYQATAIIPAGADLTPYSEAITAACAERKWALSDLTAPLPIKPIDLAKNPGMEGCHTLRLKSERKPPCVDEAMTEVINPEKFYAGCYVRFSIHCFAWEFGGRKGVSFGLDACQFLEEGERFGGGVGMDNISSVFTPVAGAKPATGEAGPASGGDAAAALFGN